MSHNIALIRPATLNDLDNFLIFAQETGPGLTTLPRNEAFLKEALIQSELSFSQKVSIGQKEVYLFCLEYEGEVIGSSGLVSHIGVEAPFFAFHKRMEKIHSKRLSIERDHLILHFIEARKKPTEVGTLFLRKEWRGEGFGPLLSYARFLFLFLNRERFAPTTIAEMRGVNSSGISPFWEGVGRHFFEMDFSEADRMRITQPSIIEELFPRYPIYSQLLPKEAQEVIGVPHPHTVPAKKMLERQGFRHSEYVDIFDAGPHLYVPTDEIDTIKNSKRASIVKLTPHFLGKRECLVANTQNEFRACFSDLVIEEKGVTLPIEVARALNVDLGEEIIYYRRHE